MNFVFPENIPPKERIIKVFVSYLLKNENRENETIRHLTLSFLQDKVNFVMTKTKNYYRLLRINPFESLPGLIVPVDDTEINIYYKEIENYLNDQKSVTLNALKKKCPFTNQKIFFYICIVFTNKVIEMNFRKIKTVQEKIIPKMRECSASEEFNQNQRNFLNQIITSFSSSTILDLKNTQTISLEMKLFIITVLSLFHSTGTTNNFLTQIANQIKNKSLKSIFLNVSNMFSMNKKLQIKVTKLWKCKNCGNIFGLGGSGKPWNIFKCVCGVDIGGKRHAPTPNTVELTPEENKRYTMRRDKYNIHEYLHDSYKTFIGLHPLCFRFLHCFIHALYLGWIETNFISKATISEVLLTLLDKDFQHLKVTDKRDYFKRHLEVDFEVIQKIRNKNYLEYNLMTSLVIRMFDTFISFNNQAETLENFNNIAIGIGASFSQLISGNNNSLTIEGKIEKFLKETSSGIKNEEKEIILRNVTFKPSKEGELNKFLFYNYRNINIPSMSNMMDYMVNNPALSKKHSFITFYNEYKGILDGQFANTFLEMRDMCRFMNNYLQNEFKKEDMIKLKVVEFIQSIGKSLY